jgi:hypothetical protein
VFRLIKLLMSLAALAGFVWFGANVPLGTRTLFGHLQAIGQTREAHDLVEGTKESARPLVEEAGRRLAHKAEQPSNGSSPEKSAPSEHPGSSEAPAERPPSEHVSDGDKQALRHVLGNAAARKPPHAVR